MGFFNKQDYLIFVLYALFASVFGLLIIGFHAWSGWGMTEESLFFLIIPIFYFAFNYKNRVYLPVMAIAILVSFCVILMTVNQVLPSLTTLTIISMTLLISCELLHRSFQWKSQMEEIVRREREFLQKINETAPISITMVDKKGQIVYANFNSEKLFGLTKSDIHKRTYNDPQWQIADMDGNLLPDKELPFRRVVDAGKTIMGMKHSVTSADGERVFLSVNGTPLFNSDGEMESVVFSIEDITDITRTEQALQESQQRIANAFLLSPDPCLITRVHDGMIIDGNDRFFHSTGYTREEAIGKTTAEIHRWVEPEQRSVYIDTLQEHGEVNNFEVWFRLKNGEEKPFLISSRPAKLNGEDCIITVSRDISDRKKMEEETLRMAKEVRETRDVLETTMNAIPDVIAVQKPDQTIIRYNQAGYELLQKPPDQVIGRKCYELMGYNTPCEQCPTIKALETKQIAEEEKYIEEFRKWLNIRTYPIVDEQGNITRIIEHLRDITQQKEADRALKESEQRFKELAEMLPAIVIEIDANGAITYVNQYGFRHTGYTQADVDQGFQPAQLMVPEDRDRLNRNIMRLLQGEPTETNEYTAQKKNGERFTVLSKSEPVYRDNTLAGFRTVIFDISDRKQAEDALRESEEKYRKIFTESLMGIYVYQLDSFDDLIFIDSNPAADQITGLDTRSLLGKKIEEAFPALATTEIPKRYKQAAKNAIPWQMNNLAYEDFDVKGFYDINVFQSSPGQVTVMFSDVTERKKLEEQLLQSQKMESIGQLAGGVAHDFNNLLTGILGYSDLLMAQMQSDDSSYAAIQEIHKAGKRAASLTQQLLAFSRKQILEPKVINLNDLVNNLDKMLRRIIGENIEYKTQLEPALDQVKADPGKIEQIIMNLVVNARDAMPLGGRLWLETQNIMLDEAYCRHQSDCEPGNYVMLSVSDTGMGMDAETLNRAFDPFFTTKETGKGTGLGLSTVYGIVKQSNGHIAIYSEEKIGTTFKVFLPAHAVPIESSTNMADKEKENLKGTETILVVEDEKAVRDLLLHVLGQYGYTVFQARDCQQAFDLEQEYKEPIHLILTDVVLPNKSGREIVEQVRQNRPAIQVLYMSGYTDDAIVQHGVLEEGLEFIQKPFETKRLLRKIREILDRG